MAVINYFNECNTVCHVRKRVGHKYSITYVVKFDVVLTVHRN